LECSVSRRMKQQLNNRLIAAQRLSLIALVLVLGGCGKTSLQLSYGDVETLDRINASSAVFLKNASTDIRVLGDGAIEIVKRGEEQVDEDSREDPSNREGLWLPIVLVRQLPSYYEAKGSFDGGTPELEAYQLDGGLWCIAAVTGPRLERSDTRVPVAARDEADNGLHVILYSENFVSELPLLIPTGRSEGSSTISISLPAKSSFDSTEITGRLEESRRTAEKPTAKRVRQRDIRLTELPESISQGVVKAAGDVDSSDVAAWDLSKVSFRLPLSFWRFKPWFFPSALSILCAVFSVWLLYYPLGRGELGFVRQESAALSRMESAVIWALRGFDRAAVSESPHSSESINEWFFVRRSTELLMRLQYEFAERRKQKERRGEESVSLDPFLIEEIDSLLLRGWEQEKSVRPSFPQADLNLRAFYLREIVSSFRSFERVREERSYERQRKAFRRLGWILAVSGLVAAIWFLATLAYGQTPSPPKTPARAAALAEMSVIVAPRDAHGPDREKVGVTLRFYPLTSDRNAGSPAEIGIETSGNQKMDPLPRAGDSAPVTVLQQTERSVRLSVHASYSSAVRRLGVLGNGVKSFVPPKAYLKSLEKADWVEINYLVDGSQHVKERAQNGWLYWFPFDSVAVDLPLRFQELALLSQVEFQKQAELEGDVWLAGPNIALEQSEDGTKYRVARDDDSHRLSVLPGTDLRLVANLERKPLQKYGLTAGLLIIAALVGLVIGKLMSLKDSAPYQTLVGALGILALPAGIRAMVFAQYKELPTIATGVGITVFEGCFFVGVLVVAAVSFAARSWFK
jgi:hypothetical protein